MKIQKMNKKGLIGKLILVIVVIAAGYFALKYLGLI